ncbi:MAG: hypothetical protein PVI30_17820 [Myxococcales bacterium]|jgi:hypothetical protein
MHHAAGRHVCSAVIFLLVIVLAGCGGATQEPTGPSAPAAAETAGGGEAPATPTPAAEPEPEPPPAGPGTITVTARVRGEAVPAAVKLIAADGSEITGASGEIISAQSGDYTLEVAITDPAILADTPTQSTALTLAPGDAVMQPVDFPWAMVQLAVKINGKPAKGAKVDIMRHGEVVATFEAMADPRPISPGRYSARVRTRSAEIEVPELMFPDGATRTVPVDVAL